MKTIPSILLIIGLSAGIPSQIRAQDAPSRPLREPVVETTPEVSPSPSETVTPTPPANKPTPHKTPATTPANSPRETKKKAVIKRKKTQAKVQSTPGPTPQKSSTKIENKPLPEANKPAAETSVPSRKTRRAEAAKLRAMEKQWEAAFNEPAIIERMLADDFIGTSPAGQIVSKKSLIRDAKAENSAPPSVARHLNVHFYAPNLAVVVGAAKQTVTDKAGKKVKHEYRFTDTWVERGGQWQCVASQTTLLPKS